MMIKYVHDPKGVKNTDGFRVDGKTLFERVPGIIIPITIERPEITKSVTYSSGHAAKKKNCDDTCFPGSHVEGSSTKITIRGNGVINGCGTSAATTLSVLGSKCTHKKMDIHIENQRDIVSSTFSVDVLDGNFVLTGKIPYKEIKFLAEELEETKRALSVNLSIGLFPGFFGVLATGGWDGGDVVYADDAICEKVVENFKDMHPHNIQRQVFSPDKLISTYEDTQSPFNLVEFKIVTRDT